MYKSTLKNTIKILFYVFLVSVKTIGQTENNPNTFLPNIIPPSPSAYQLGNYGNVPVGMFTGSPNINIPIYNYKTANLEVPITMFYSNNGIKVDEISSNVGQGWNLNFGGVVTRIIRDLPDEERSNPFVPLGDFPTMAQRIAFYKYIGEDEQVDSEADLYSFNFGNYSGKFIYDHDGTLVFMPAQNIKIEKQQYSAGYFIFIITTPDGVKYTFDQIEYTKLFKQFAGGLTKTSITSWYLSKIVHPKGDEIYFKYIDKTDDFTSSKSQTLTLQFPKMQTGCTSSAVTSSPRLSPIIDQRISITGKAIQTISSNNSNNGEITFQYFDNNSEDVETGNKKIKEIAITINKTTEIEKVQFTYTTTLNKRVFLDKIQFKDINKNYQFEYIDRNNFPPRLSLSQDHWGYYNGKLNTKIVPNKTELDLDNIDYGGANKEPNVSFAKIGMLNKIIYPTKGSTSFEYESNDYYGDKIIYPELKSERLYIDRAGPITKEVTITTLSDQEIVFSGGVNFDEYECQLDDLGKTRSSLRVKNMATGNYMSLSIRSSSGELVAIGNSADFRRGNVSEFILLAKANQTYTISLSLIGASTQTMLRPCTSSGLDFTYLPSVPEAIKTNIISGGVRIKSTKDNAFPISTPTYKRYFYASKDDLTKSSGFSGVSPVYLDISREYNRCANDTGNGSGIGGSGGYLRTFANITSSSLTSLFDNGNSSVSYQYVTISNGDDNFINGGEMNEFYVRRNSNNQISGDLRLYSAPTDYGLLTNGLLMENRIFNNKKIDVQTTTNSYDNIELKESKSYYTRKYYELVDDNEGEPNATKTSNLGIVAYLNSSYWSYLKSKENILYDIKGLNPIKTITNYVYNNPAHLQLSTQRTKNSTGDYLETKYYYPQDSEMVNEPLRTELIAQHMVAIPLKTENYKGNEKLSEQTTKYASFPSSISGQFLLLPKFIHQKKGNITLSNESDRKIAFDNYDTLGNITQYTPEGGTPICYIWGYNKTQPIAKIENATYASIPLETITSLQALSNADDDNCMSANCTEQLLRNGLDAFRATLPNAFITTYTYNPLVGVTSITDPSRISTYYHYDKFNRLQYIKDQDLNIVQTHYYNYKGQIIDYLLPEASIYKNVAVSKIYTKNDCSTGASASVMYKVAIGTFSSSISQADADAQAQADISKNGQAYANNNGVCSYRNKGISKLFTKNDCGETGIPATMYYTIAEGRYNSTISQADADAQAQVNLNNFGQEYVNANGYCTYQNEELRGNFSLFSEDFGLFKVAYHVPSGKFTSTISQIDADEIAQQGLSQCQNEYSCLMVECQELSEEDGMAITNYDCDNISFTIMPFEEEN